MSLNKIDFSKTLNDDQVLNCLNKNFRDLGKQWVQHQWNWMNYVYAPFKDHTKYFVLISLIEKNLQFYDQMNIDYSFEQFYSKSQLHIEKFSISEICEKLLLPKETIRRKVLELEKLGVIKRKKKKIIIDRTAFAILDPNQQLRITAKYIFSFAKQLSKNKEIQSILYKDLNLDFIENVIKKNFSLCLRWFYRMQIPLILSYNKFFSDTLTFHVYGTVVMNQAFNLSNSHVTTIDPSRLVFNKQLILEGQNSSGLSAMSISDMTKIPRATVVRKCKILIQKNFVDINDKKQFVMSGRKMKELVSHQEELFKNKSKFLRKMLNLIIIS
jgi:hypothetical protein